MDNEIILTRHERSDLPRLLELWEASVRATHHFLAEEDIIFFRKVIIQDAMFENADLMCARMGECLAGFVGVAGDSLEMLFVDPAHIGAGIGAALMRHAINIRGVKRVQVNEQNELARQFYEYFGFSVVSRSELDEMGKPFPILDMKLR